MPIVKRFRGCVLRINPREHNPPHFHLVMNDGREALVEIDTLSITGNADRREVADALEWAAAHRDKLKRLFEELTK